MPSPTRLWMPFVVESSEPPALPAANQQELRVLIARLLLQMLGALASVADEEVTDEDR